MLRDEPRATEILRRVHGQSHVGPPLALRGIQATRRKTIRVLENVLVHVFTVMGQVTFAPAALQRSEGEDLGAGPDRQLVERAAEVEPAGQVKLE